MLMNKTTGQHILLEVRDVLLNHDVPFFLIQGTCLGAVRDHGFVPDEKDIDLGILQENIDLVPIRTWQDLGYDIELFAMPFNRVRTIVLWKYDIKVDLVGFTKWTLKTDCMGGMSIGKSVRFTASPVRHWIERPYAIVHDSILLENYTAMDMFGETWNVPINPELYLTNEYGNDWMIPGDDHVSRTRIYDFLEREGIPHDYLERRAK